MTATTAVATTERSRLRWWKEIALVLGFYIAYSWVRNRFGSATVGPDDAYDNAKLVIDIEAAMLLDLEATLQGWFLGADWFFWIWNVFYGTFHFIVTGFALVFLYRRHPADYPRWRTIGLITTGLALVGFASFPLMPPRLLGDCGIYGACVQSEYVDTVADIGGLWSFDSGAMAELSNQYAAMPSLHFSWSFWCFLVLAPRLSNRWAKWAITAYPWLTLFAIMVTANHYWLDAAGGALALAVAFCTGTALTNALQKRGFDHGVDHREASIRPG